MRWSNGRQRFVNKVAKLKPWHLWFAWYPIEIDDKIYWMEYVWRSGREQFYWRITYTYRSYEDNPHGKK